MSRARGILCVALALAGCRDVAADAPLLLAASSTADALANLHIRVSTGASNALAAQILAGAPAEVFLSANPRWADAVRAIERRPLLTNRLVIVVPRGNPGRVSKPADLAEGRVALAGENVPAGIYAAQALRHAGVFDELEAGNLVARGGDVRLTLGYVETGEAQAGVVYATDARASDRVEVVYTFPADSHDAIVYPLVLLRPSGRALYELLQSDEALAVFERHGFSRIADGSR